MPYIQRNEQGKIAALTMTGDASAEFLPADHFEVLQFLMMPAHLNTAEIELLQHDLKLIRVIEDVIDILIAKNIIIFSDLPQAVQKKILQKRGQREKLFGGGVDIIGSEEGIL